MKPISPHDPLDDLIAAALHGELTPEERTQFEARLSNDPAAQAAYQEAQAMHDLLEKTHKNAQPDSAFEQRMVSGVRRKIQTEQNRETAWESLKALWVGTKGFFGKSRKPIPYLGSGIAVLVIVFLFAGVSLGPITNGIKKAQQSADLQEGHAIAMAEYQAQVDAGVRNPTAKGVKALPDGRIVEFSDGDDTRSAVDITDKVRLFSRTGVLPVGPNVAASPSTASSVFGQPRGVFSTITSQLAMAGSAGTAPIDNFTKTRVTLPQATQSSTQQHDEQKLAQLEKIDQHYQEQLQANPSDQNLAKQLQRIDALKDRYAAKVATDNNGPISLSSANSYTGATTLNAGSIAVASAGATTDYAEPATTTVPQGGTIRGSGFIAPINAPTLGNTPAAPVAKSVDGEIAQKKTDADVAAASAAPSVTTQSGMQKNVDAMKEFPYPAPADTTPPAVDDRKLIRNAQLDLEVKSYQAAMDQITALTKTAGGYVDTSNSQKGGNGKLQGTVVVKVLPQNLDAFLLKLRDLGQVNNQSVSTDDVTKDYFDTQARLVNSQKMETQLQDLLKRENGKVSDLLAVERELGRVRGEIEQMQGQLKLYDFQVQYATVTMQLREKDLNQAAAYLLKEQDDFSLFATDVEGTFQKARQAAEDFKAQVLAANLNHNSGSDVSAELMVMVAPDQIEPFLAQVRSLGRVANFTRQTQRVAKDGGDSDQPADQTLTEKDKVQVHLAIRSDDETRKQVALTVVAKAVDEALDQAKTAALANAGVEILSSSLNKTPDGTSTAALTVRVPGKDYSSVIDGFKALGRTASLSIQRNDDSGPGTNGDDAPVIVSLSLTDDDTPLQETQMSVLSNDVDNQAQQIKQVAAASGVEVKASSFERQPDGTQTAQLTFRLPMAKYAGFMESLNKLGKVESLTVHRDDRPDQARTDDTAPAEISLQMHNQGDIVSEDNGLWATLRQTFGQGAGALFVSVRVIGVVVAFLIPWVFTLGLLAWVGRRIYIWRKR